MTTITIDEIKKLATYINVEAYTSEQDYKIRYFINGVEVSQSEYREVETILDKIRY